MPLQYNVATLLKEPVGSTRDYDLDSGVLIENDEPHVERVAGHATLLRTNDGLLVTARVDGSQRERCSRCLREIAVPVHLEIVEQFYLSVDPVTGAKVPPPEDPDALRIDARHTLDLEDTVRQYWTVSRAMQPLCRPDCRGLCPRCGADLNGGECACPPEEDERWSTLRELMREREGS